MTPQKTSLFELLHEQNTFLSGKDKLKIAENIA